MSSGGDCLQKIIKESVNLCEKSGRHNFHTTEKRRKNMQAIKNKDTKIEISLRKELWKRGIRYRKNVKGIAGHPDLAFISLKIAVFCDSEFWHGYNWEKNKMLIKSNRDFWIQKIERNMKRDSEVTKFLSDNGWIVLRFWGNEIKKNVCECADRIETAIKNRRIENEKS